MDAEWQLILSIAKVVYGGLDIIHCIGSYLYIGAQWEREGSYVKNKHHSAHIATQDLTSKIEHLQKAGKPVGLLAAAVPREHAEQLVGLLHCDLTRRSSKVQPKMLPSCTSHP